MPPGASLWHSLLVRHARSLKEVLYKASKALDAQFSSGQPQAKLQTILVRNTPKQPLHPLARIRQSQSRWYSTTRNSFNGAARHFSSSSTAGRTGINYSRASFATSKVGSQISKSSGRAPFASTLRPNLTGGTLGRTAGGYTLGSGRVGGARFFSHGPASQAQVIQNVSQGIRAFFVSGQKAQFDGVSSHTGEKRYKTVSALQEETSRKLRCLPKATPGSTLRYAINPSITALTSLGAVTGYSTSEYVQSDHLNSSGLLAALSTDFSRALKELAAVLNDLKKLSTIGDLPITCEGSDLLVHFPGCDADTIERLCGDLNLQRGTVIQDASFDSFAGTEIALLFPFAPSEECSECESLFDYVPTTKPPASKRQVISIDDMFSPSSPAYSTQSDSGMEDVEDVIATNPWLHSSPPSIYDSVSLRSDSRYGSEDHSPLEYQGFEGIYRFIEELDAVRR